MLSQDKKIELLRQRIASLSPEKRAIFEQQLKQKNLDFQEQKISVVQDKDDLKLSYAQERLWFLSQLDPENPTYNIAVTWKIQGHLNVNIFWQAFLAIIKRHQGLRTTFISDEHGKPKIKINEVNNLDLPIIDLRNNHATEIKVKNISKAIARKPFHLDREIPIRLSLIRLSETESVVIIILHHIIADGWSRGILLKEFSLFYKSISNNSLIPEETTKTQYTDFAAWERKWLRGKEQDIQLNYWKQQLANLSTLNLPTDFPRQPIQTFKGKTEFFNLSLEITEQIKNFSRQQGVSLFMTLLTAFKILLHRYTGQKDIAVGSPVANRNLKEVENIIGFFVNTLVLRSDLSDNPCFLDLLTQVKTTTNQAYKHQELPFAKLVEELHPERNLSQNPLFQVMIQFQNQAYQLQNAVSPELIVPELNLTQEWIDTGVTKFDLTWHLIERETGILVAIEYSSDLFYAETIKRMFGHFEVLLTSIVNDPQARLSELSILTPKESKQILVDWNQTHTDLPSKQCFYQLFEDQVKQTPDNIAIETLRGQSLTYKELNQKADQLALYLRSVGVSLETKVGICLERSPELIISLLAVQKAGGTYIPLDPNYPQARLNYIVEDSQLTVLLTQIKYQEKFTNNDLTIINLDRSLLPAPCSPASTAPPLPAPCPSASSTPHPKNLAYIIYTSGSTGKPKGTMISHQGLVNYLTWAIGKYPIATGNGFPVHSSISFDATITSLYTALLVGQKIILFPEENELETLKDVLNSSNNYSAIKLTPAHLNAIARLSTNDEVVNPAQTFIIGGEALTKDAIAQWQKRAPQTKLINEYGPTETVVGCCTYEIPPKTIFQNQIPIGSPIANTQLYILDEYLQPVPVGIPGELYIGGHGVARGYLQQPELTAEKFIPNPFFEGRRQKAEGRSLGTSSAPLPLSSSVPSASSAPLCEAVSFRAARLYKTGDRAKYLPDGTIEYLGRLDNQIKIRGYRIELGEIEAELTNHSDVQSALVIARDERLIAYFIPHRACDVSTLRSFLQNKLPSYMVPGNFVQLDRFPLTPNGKIDRAALPLPELETRKAQVIEPSTEKEKILVKIWQEVLNLDRIDIEDNFFELGGDSILSIQIIARARQARLTFTPKQLFQYQTIAELAAIALENKPIQAEQGLVTGKIPLTPIQHWFFEQELVDLNHYNQAILLEVTTELNPDWLQAALKHLVSHHDALRISFNNENSSWTASNLESVEDPNFITVDLREAKNEALEQSITETANQLQTSLDISQGKLVTGALFRLGNSKSDRLLLIIHHLVVDGISWRILLEDLAIAYKQLETKQSLQLPPKTASYKSWGKTLEKYSQEIDTKSELDYWLNKNEIASIPTDKSASQETNTIASTKQISVVLDKVMTNSLLTEVPKTYKTNVEDILLTALIQSFYLWTNSKEILLDLENYGRGKVWEKIDISRTVGWFTTIYPVRLQLDNFNQTGETIKSIKEQLRSSQYHGLNYGILKYLNSESTQELKQLSSPQIAFNYLGQLNPPPTESIIQGLATESTGSNRHPLGKRCYLLEINSAIVDGQLKINWVYSQNFHNQTTITKLANNFLESLKNLIKHCQSPETNGYTPSDFSAAKTSQKQLDKLMMQIQRKK